MAVLGKRRRFIGTPYWMAPEVATVEKTGGYDMNFIKCDVWAVGIVAIELAETQPPMFDLHPMRALYLMSKSNFKPPTLKHMEKWSDEMHNFVKHCLKRDPKRRPGARELLEHPFFDCGLEQDLMIDLLHKAMHPDDLPREDTEEVEHAPQSQSDHQLEEHSSAVSNQPPPPAPNTPPLPPKPVTMSGGQSDTTVPSPQCGQNESPPPLPDRKQKYMCM